MVLTLISLSNCAYNPAKLTPTFIDTTNGVCREYKVKTVRPKITFEFKEQYPISHCDGYVALPPAQALEVQREYEESLKKGKK